MNVAGSLARYAARASGSRRAFHVSHTRYAVTNMQMPAMSPTMTEGGIASWKVKEGDSFSAGDILLEIETDKATIDVEAQDDGVLGKIIMKDGSKNVAVGKVIALLAEEGDDLSNLQAPAEDSPPQQAAPPKDESSSAPKSEAQSKASESSGSTQAAQAHGHPKHSRPLFPSVMRILTEHGINDAGKIKGTGIRGMLTKGDVLAFLGKASGPLGTYKEPKTHLPTVTPTKKDATPKPLDGPAIRMAILEGMLSASKLKAPALPKDIDIDSIIADYLPPSKASAPKTPIPPPPSKPSGDWLDGLL